jgi:hypothetical protein
MNTPRSHERSDSTLSRAQLLHALTSAATPRSHERSYPTLSRAQRLHALTSAATPRSHERSYINKWNNIHFRAGRAMFTGWSISDD